MLAVLQKLVIAAGDIDQNVLDFAVQDTAQVVECGGIQRLVFAEFVDGGAGNPVVFNQGIGGFVGFAQCGPEGCVRNHNATPQNSLRLS